MLLKSYKRALSLEEIMQEQFTLPNALSAKQVKNIVNKQLKKNKLISKLNLQDWNIQFLFDACDNTHWAAQCEQDPAYKIARVTINPGLHETEEEVINSLVHELMHIVLAPVEGVHMIDLAGYDEDSPEFRRSHEQWRQACEQLVCSLTKSYTALLSAKD